MMIPPSAEAAAAAGDAEARAALADVKLWEGAGAAGWRVWPRFKTKNTGHYYYESPAGQRFMKRGDACDAGKEEEVGDMAVVVEQGEQVKEFPKPSGRAPRNCVWDAEVGKWWDEVQEIHRERKPRSKRSKRSKSKEPPQATNSNP